MEDNKHLSFNQANSGAPIFLTLLHKIKKIGLKQFRLLIIKREYGKKYMISVMSHLYGFIS